MNQTNTYYRVGPHVLRIGGAEPLEPSALLPSFAPFVLSVEEGEKAAEVIEVDIRPSEVTAVTTSKTLFRNPSPSNGRMPVAPFAAMPTEAIGSASLR